MRLATKITTKDVLKFKDTKSYSQRIKEAVSSTGEEEAIVIGKGKLEGAEIVVAAFEFRYMGGSMGGAVGTKFVQGVDAAIEMQSSIDMFFYEWRGQNARVYGFINADGKNISSIRKT